MHGFPSIFFSHFSPHPPGNYKEQREDPCDFVSHNKQAWNEAFAAAPICLISMALQRQRKCKHDWRKRDFPEFNLWEFNNASTSLSVLSLIRSIRGIHLQALYRVALRSFVSTPTPLQTNSRMSCGENSLSEHILIINSLIAPLFLQELWNQNPKNTIPTLITALTNALLPLHLLNPPLYFYHFSHLYSFMFSFPSFCSLPLSVGSY